MNYKLTLKILRVLEKFGYLGSEVNRFGQLKRLLRVRKFKYFGKIRDLGRLVDF